MAQTAVAQSVLWRREKNTFASTHCLGVEVCAAVEHMLYKQINPLFFFFSVCVPQSCPERGSQYLEELCLLKAEKLAFEVC